MEKSLMIIDGNSVINRAFYGVKPLSTREGFQTNAIFGFLRILKRYLSDYKPDALCVAFDLHAPTFRHVMYDGYKATRKGMPEELAAQMPVMKDVLTALSIPYLTLEGYEADDILGTAARRCSEEGWRCLIVTGDRDSFQLVSGSTSVLHVGTKSDEIYTPDSVKERYGLSPEQMIDLKALMGDSSDNIPGVPGVGEKTALDLMLRYGSLDSVYENLDEITGKLRDKLTTGKDMAYLSRELGRINCRVPIEFSPDDMLRKAPDGKAAREIFTRLEFTKIIGDWIKPEQAAYENLGMFTEIPLPEGVGRNIKALWKVQMDAEQPLMPYKYDAALAAWLLQKPEAPWNEMERELKETGMWELFEQVEMPLCEVLASMEHTGFKVDRNALVMYGEMLDEKIKESTAEIFSLAGQEFNIQSPKQLGEILFEKLQLPHGRKNKTGWSTDADTLDKLKSHHPVVGEILNYRGLAKLKSTYADGLLKVMDGNDRIHSTFQMTATLTGRLSSTEPNLQNIPVRTELGGRLRGMFIPSRPDWLLIDADYSQIELRVLAHIADDAVMKKAFASGEDIHTVTASQVFGVDQGDITSVMRRHAKAVNFGIVYGISDFSLADDIGVSRAQAKRYIEQYLEKYSGVRTYMTEIVEKAKRDGYVTTLLGRRRIIPELHSSNFNIRGFGQRAAMNTPIQGTAADIIKLAMIAVYNRLKRDGLQARLLLQVHDELIVECPPEEKDAVLRLVQEEMEGVYSLSAPLVAEAHAGKSWLDAK